MMAAAGSRGNRSSLGAARPGSRRAAGLSPQVAELQRRRLVAAALDVVYESGVADAAVTRITGRARISRRTFYELFENRDECLAQMFAEVFARVHREVAESVANAWSWRERIRWGLWRILDLFDRDPVLAQVCVVQSAHASGRALELRAQALIRLADAIDEARNQGARAGALPRLTAEGLVGAVQAIVGERMLRGGSVPLTELLGELMAMIVLPYLGPAAARRELERALPGESHLPIAVPGSEELDPLAGISMRLTYRTARVLDSIAGSPGVSNREVGERAGVADQGQISKLLSRLVKHGLVINSGSGHARGESNSWTLTPAGQKLAQTIRSRM